MSNLYKEALADAKKLRQIAEEDARKAIMEKVAPYIKKMLAETTYSSNLTNLFEEEEMDNFNSSNPNTDNDKELHTQEETTTDFSSNSNDPLPISVGNTDITANIPLSDVSDDGKITIDFEQLFVSPADTITPLDLNTIAPNDDITNPSSEAVAPVKTKNSTESAESENVSMEASDEETETSVNFEKEKENVALNETFTSFKNRLAEVTLNIDKVCYTSNCSDIVYERLKNSLLNLLESLDKMHENGLINDNQVTLNEKKLEFLFLKLKEAKMQYSYKKEITKKDVPMDKTLKKYAAKLFESDDHDFLDTDNVSTPVHKSTSSKEVDDLFKEEMDNENIRLFSELEPKSSSDSEISETELLEAIALVKKGAKDNFDFEGSFGGFEKDADKGGWEEKGPMKKLKKKNIKEDIVLSIDLPDDLENQLEDDDIKIDMKLSQDEEDDELEDEEVQDIEDEEEDDELEDEEVQDLEDEEDSLSVFDDEEVSSEKNLLLTDEEETSDLKSNSKSLQESKNLKALIYRLRAEKATKMLKESRKLTRQLHNEMAQTNLFLAKLLYLNKFLQREGLSRKVKNQIIKHLDSARTIAEAKNIYFKIKKKLDMASSSLSNGKFAGSSSKPTTPGSARLNENVSFGKLNHGEAIIGTIERWQKLAKIKLDD